MMMILKIFLTLVCLAMHSVCSARDSIVASMASIPQREKCLECVVDAILPQVDHLNVYLNNYAHIPAFLAHPNITVACSQEFGDIGDNGKFFWVASIEGYHLTIDDDIRYPPDYVQYCINKIELYNRECVVGIHGSILDKVVKNYYKNRKYFSFKHALYKDSGVHIIGTGTLAYHTDTIRVSFDDFPVKNMADIWFALLGQKQKIPFVCLERPKNYLSDLLAPGPSIFEEKVDSCEYQTEVINTHCPWVIYTPNSN